MSPTLQGATVDSVLRRLAGHRRAIYVGGMVVASLPLFLATELNVHLSRPVRVGVVAASLAVMGLTYLGERRVPGDATDAGETAAYDGRTRLVFGAIVVGVAVGIYVTLEVDPRAGSLYLLGSLLYGYREYRKRSGDGRSPRR